MTFTSDSEEGEISPEALEQLNVLLDQAPGDDASEEEVSEFMAKFSATPGGGALLESLRKELAEGGGALLSGLLGQATNFDDGFDVSLYRPPSSSLRLVFRVQDNGAKLPHWRRISLPSDACFYDLHLAAQDAFQLEGNGSFRFEWREGETVAATFLTVKGASVEGEDYCAFQNRPLDLFSEGVERLYYCLPASGVPELAVFMEKLIDRNSFENPSGSSPDCIGGQGPGEEFHCGQITFRTPGG